MIRNKIIFLGVIGGLSAHALDLNWETALKTARESNASLKSAQELYLAAEQSAKAAYAPFLPQVSASANVDRVGSSDASSTVRTFALAASENLFAGFQDVAKVRQNDANKLIAAASLQIAQAQLSYDLKTAFAGVVYAERLEKLSSDILERRTNNLRLVELRFEGGRENRGAVLLSQASLDQARLEQFQAQNQKRKAIITLAKTLGLDSSDALSIQGQVPLASPPAQINLDELVFSSPDYTQSLQREKVAEAARTLAKSTFYPSLALVAETDLQKKYPRPETHEWSAGLHLSLPLFNGGKDYYGVGAAGANWAASRRQSEELRRDLRLKLETAYNSFQESVLKLNADQSFRKALRVRAEIARNQYNNGLANFQDWDQIENELITREKNLLSSERDRVANEASWEQAQGKGAI